MPPTLPPDAADKRLARVHPAHFIKNFREGLSGKGAAMLARLFELATSSDYRPEVNLNAMRLVVEIADKIDKANPPPPEDVIDAELSKEETERYERAAGGSSDADTESDPE